jgi:taurine dioxygenase
MDNFKTIQVTALTGVLGAEVSGVNLAEQIDEATISEIKQAWLTYSVLFFRAQHLTPETHKKFGEYFGTLKNEFMLFGNAPKDIDPYVLTAENGTMSYAPATDRLHIDHSSSDIPNKATILQAIICPESGGDTLWVSCYAAYDALSEHMQKFLEGLTGYFPPMDCDRIDKYMVLGPHATKPTKMQREAAEHPLVHVHPETGKKALFVDFLRMWSIKELNREESQMLITFLAAHCAKPELQCRFHWEAGSIAIWDNRCTLHQLVNDEIKSRRVMQTVRVEDTERPVFQ